MAQHEQTFKHPGNSGHGKKKGMKSGLTRKRVPEFDLEHTGSQDPQGGCLQKKTKGEGEEEWEGEPSDHGE